MKNSFSKIFGSKGQAEKDTEHKHEASMNFDSENILPFLIDLNNKFGFAMNVDQLNEFALSVPVEQEKTIETNIELSGDKSAMEFRVFMDDIDAPDLYLFFESAVISDKVSDFMLEWAESRGM